MPLILTDNQLEKIELMIDYKFSNRELLRLACNPKLNKNLETGGDGILDVIIYSAEFIRAVTKKHTYYAMGRYVASRFFHEKHLENSCHQETKLAKAIRFMLYPEHKDKRYGRVKAGNIVEAILCAVLIDTGDFRHHTHEFITRVATIIFDTTPISDEEIRILIATEIPPATLRRDKRPSGIYYDVGCIYGTGKEGFTFNSTMDRDVKTCLERIGEGLLKYALSRMQDEQNESHEWFEFWRTVLESDEDFKVELASQFLEGRFICPSRLPCEELEGKKASDLESKSPQQCLGSKVFDYYQQYDRSIIMVHNAVQKISSYLSSSSSSRKLAAEYQLKLERKFIECCEKHEEQVMMYNEFYREPPPEPTDYRCSRGMLAGFFMSVIGASTVAYVATNNSIGPRL